MGMIIENQPSMNRLGDRCANCLLNTWSVMIRQEQLSSAEIQQFDDQVSTIIENNPHLGAPELQRRLSLLFRQFTGINDPYLEKKQQSNQQASVLYTVWKEKVAQSDEPFEMALRLALAANIMDYGVAISRDMDATIERVFKSKLAIDDSGKLKTAIKNAKSILYLGDNAGEIYFDKLFIETINHPHVTFVVRGGLALNDATLEDAAEVGMSSCAKVITNGYDSPSTLLEKADDDFKQHFEQADLIISKGMGNLEGLMRYKDSRIFFLLMAKCEVVADYLNVEKGSFVVAVNPYK